MVFIFSSGVIYIFSNAFENISDLHHQRETLQGARARLMETNADLGRASRTLNSMMLRALREKVVLYGVGVCFVVAVGVSLYLTFAPSSTAATS